jgi:hypothetical protein
MCTPKHKKTSRKEKRIAVASGLSNVALDGKSGGLDVINPTTKPKGTNISNPKTNSSLFRLYVVVVMSVAATEKDMRTTSVRKKILLFASC